MENVHSGAPTGVSGADFDPLAEPVEEVSVEQELAEDATTEDVIAAALVKVVELLTKQNELLGKILLQVDQGITNEQFVSQR